VGYKFIWWLYKWVLIGPAMRVFFRPTAYGTENIPADGPVILASNHLSWSDWIFTPLAIKRRITFVAKAEYFTTPGFKGGLQKFFFTSAGQVPIERGSASAAEGALEASRKVLREGNIMGIYPEGTRSHSGKLYKGRTGVARLAIEMGVPVVPVGLVGTDRVAPPGKTFGKIGARPIVHFGEPLDFSRYEGMENDRFILRAVTDEIIYEILKLTGQEYVDMYATDAKKRDKAAYKSTQVEAEEPTKKKRKSRKA
jgi:1-acyl-sn-glycerol-3-phosphate acyltransferase